MVDLALEFVDTHPVGEVTLGRKTRRQQQIFGICMSPIIGVDDPSRRWLVESCPHDASLERDVFFDIKFLLDMLEVLAKFCEAGVSFGPCPVLRHESQFKCQHRIHKVLTCQTSGIEYSYIGT